MMQRNLKRFMIGFAIGAILTIFISQNIQVRFFAFLTLALLATITFVYDEYTMWKMIKESEVVIAYGNFLSDSINSDRVLLQKCSKIECGIIMCRIQSNVQSLEENTQKADDLAKKIRDITTRVTYEFIIMMWFWIKLQPFPK